MISPRSLQIFVCCQALAEGLKHNSTLTNLNLIGNNNIGDTGAQAWCLMRMVNMGRCTTVRIETQLFESEFWRKGMQNWYELMLRCAIHCGMQVLQRNSTELRSKLSSWHGSTQEDLGSAVAEFLPFQLLTFAWCKLAILQTKSCFMFLSQNISVWLSVLLLGSRSHRGGWLTPCDPAVVRLVPFDKFAVGLDGRAGGDMGVAFCCPEKESSVRSWGSGVCSPRTFGFSVPKASQLLPFASTPSWTFRVCAPHHSGMGRRVPAREEEVKYSAICCRCVVA